MRNYLLFSLVALSFSTSAFTQTREQSPYLACGADVAEKYYPTKKSIGEIQKIASSSCASFLERNVSNSLAAMERDGGKINSGMKPAAQQILREKLRKGLVLLVQNNVAVRRQSLGRR